MEHWTAAENIKKSEDGFLTQISAPVLELPAWRDAMLFIAETMTSWYDLKGRKNLLPPEGQHYAIPHTDADFDSIVREFKKDPAHVGITVSYTADGKRSIILDVAVMQGLNGCILIKLEGNTTYVKRYPTMDLIGYDTLICRRIAGNVIEELVKWYKAGTPPFASQGITELYHIVLENADGQDAIIKRMMKGAPAKILKELAMAVDIMAMLSRTKIARDLRNAKGECNYNRESQYRMIFEQFCEVWLDMYSPILLHSLYYTELIMRCEYFGGWRITARAVDFLHDFDPKEAGEIHSVLMSISKK